LTRKSDRPDRFENGTIQIYMLEDTMKIRRRFILKIKDRRGVVAIVVALIMTVLIGFVALAVDTGFLFATKNELQNIADGAALAAAGELGNQYFHQESYYEPAIKTVAVDVGIKNQAGGKSNISINLNDIQIGTWNQDTDPKFDPSGTPPNAVRVIARRDGQANNPISTFFAGIFGINTVNVNADATAALDAPDQIESGGLPIPVGISKYWFDESHWPPGEFCDQDIKFHPTGGLEGCAGWHTYTSSPANASKLRGILDGLKDGSFESPETVADVTKYAFTGGTVASAFSNLEALYESKKGNCEDGVADNWCADVVVYDRDDCSNPNKSITIVGFAPVVITGILGPPKKTIEGRVLCDKAVLSRGGGKYYGIRSSIPGLVE
jgi:Flp pilus assembly protein TadG